MNGFLLQATIYLGAAVIIVPIAKRLGLGSVLGYLVAGVLIGPVLGLVGSETQDLQHFAEFGVVMMLFIVGLELEPKSLWEMRDKLLGLGGLQIALSTLAITSLFYALGNVWSISLAVGLTLALSSTAIVVQTLNEKKLMTSQGGRSAFSVLLAQDIAIIPMLALVPLLALPGLRNYGAGHNDHNASMSLVEGLPSWGVTLVIIGAVAAVILGGLFLTRPLFRYIASSRLSEMFTAITLLLVVGIALLMGMVGLSPALGTFLAGVVLANSEFRHELESDIEPFKGLLLGLFFITVGAGINFDILFDNWVSIMGTTAAVMLAKALVLYLLCILFKIRGTHRVLFTLALAQAGEFGFVMLATAVQTNVVPSALADELLLIIAISMMLTPILFIAYEQISKLKSKDGDTPEDDNIEDEGTVIIVGMGRFGQVVNRMAIACGVKTVVIDHEVEQIARMRRFGTKAYFGDPTKMHLLRAAGLDTCSVLVVAVDDDKAATKLVRLAHKARPDLHIVSRAYDREHVYALWAAGGREIVRESFDSSVRAARYMLRGLGWNDYDIERAAAEFTKRDRAALRELADLWDPKLPISKNAPYIERAKEMTKEFETSFLANLAQFADDDIAVDDQIPLDSEPSTQAKST